MLAKSYLIPLPFDANRMMVETFQAAVLPFETGQVSWVDIRSSRYKKYESTGSERIIPLVRTAYKGINRCSGSSRGRKIIRDGEEVWVYYFCYYKTLWDSLLYDGDLSIEELSDEEFDRLREQADLIWRGVI